ncbi:NAD-dependent epimerase/dehydratase family protein [Paenibacillus sp. BR2-3]|uniref:NAD-dependent epimerase/dehydratase family protein n=1 Tax=Paenibacillus sp. BR2-3 TaxID=3048494 RepID=UPI0039773AFD
MRKILITGANSYIGTSLEKWLEQYPAKYFIDTVDIRGCSWEEKDFSEYDVVFHVAGVAHIKETKENEELYYKVNRDLAYKVAGKAKVDGVKQFIFLSSMSVYGIECGVINKRSPLNPKSSYGKSKLEAEELINHLSDGAFKVVILRPPMIYGKACKGNYPKLARLALKAPVFPDIKNKRSMLYIENLSEFLRILIDNCSSGLFFPQNKEYICSSEMVKLIGVAHSKRIFMTKLFNPLLNLIKTRTVNKVFGDLVYEKNMSEYKEHYCLYDFRESIFKTEV